MNRGSLYIVATPIGNLNDMSARAVETLRAVALIAAEDTRHSSRLLQHFGINTPMQSLHDFNETERVEKILAQLGHGASVALISDAGTPLISDPGYRLVQMARAQGFEVVPIPGPCALIAALCAAGLPSDRFIFEGFLPAKANARQQHLKSLQNEIRTLIFYEAPHRILVAIEDMMLIFGADRVAVIARELTKTFETIKDGTLKDLHDWLIADLNQQKGEFVILVKGAEKSAPDENDPALTILDILLTELPVKQAAQLASKITGVKKNWLYEQALRKKL